MLCHYLVIIIRQKKTGANSLFSLAFHSRPLGKELQPTAMLSNLTDSADTAH